MPDLAVRFWAKVDMSGECWVWTAGHDADGYGFIRLESNQNHRTVRATHAMWLLEHGELPPAGMFVCHRCDNPPCVRPDHLWLGTLSDNTQDMIAKGRDKLFGGAVKARARLPIPASESDVEGSPLSSVKEMPSQ